MTNLTTIEPNRANLPAPKLMQQRLASGTALGRNFSDGVVDSYPRLSIRGKVFRVRAEGRDEIAKDPQTGHAYSYLDVVFVNASRSLAKTYYAKGFAEGDMNPPDCWSLDSVRPDASIPNPVNPTCANCPMNAFGSRVTPDGRAAKQCADSRRVAVTMPHMLMTPGPVAFLLRVPQSSLKNLKAYAEGQLARNGYEPGGCVTRLSFDPSAAYPKLQFQFVGPLTDQEYSVVVGMANSPSIAGMLDAPDFDNAASAGQLGMPATAPVQPMQRQAPPTGFGVGDLGPAAQFHDVSMAPTPQRAPPPIPPAPPTPQPPQPPTPQPAAVDEELFARLDDGSMLNLLTGEITKEEVKEPQLDPDVIKVSDGRYYHKTKRGFVAGPYVGDGPASAVPPPVAREPAKRAPRKAKEPEPQTNGPPPTASAEPEGLAQQMAAPNPGIKEPDFEEKSVVSASPRLEDLLKQMTPKKAN